MHYMKLFIRGGFFIAAVVLYITGHIEAVCENGILPAVIWIWYFVEMVLRLFPTGMESMGCEKVFAKNYKPAKVKREPKNQSWKATFAVTAAWFALNGAIFAIHLIFPNAVDKYILAMVALAYGVCDMICILFFCPFQTWFMKNRCCTTCRIYNWDFAMLCTPFLLIPSFYTYSLLALSLVILVKWEITYKLHPERFSERTNESLRCKNCTEKLCKHKVQLQHYIKQHKDILFEKLEPVVEKLEPAFNLIDDQAKGIEETVSPIEEGIQETYEKAKEKATEVYGKVKDVTTETYGIVKEKATEMYGKVKDVTTETCEIIMDKTAETISLVVDKTVEAYEAVKDKTKEILGIEKNGSNKDDSLAASDDASLAADDSAPSEITSDVEEVTSNDEDITTADAEIDSSDDTAEEIAIPEKEEV